MQESRSAAQNTDNGLRQLAIRRAHNLKGVEKTWFENGSCMTHPAKPVVSVVNADATVPDSSEGQIFLCDMQQGAIHFFNIYIEGLVLVPGFFHAQRGRYVPW